MKPVRNLTHKYIYSSNFEKMNILIALKFLNQNAESLGEKRFLVANARIEFPKVINKWVKILNVTSSSLSFNFKESRCHAFCISK